MNIRITIDKAGRIVIPQSIRNELQIQPGDSLELQSQDTAIILHLVRSVNPLKKERGVWVFRSGNKISADDSAKALKSIREQKSNKLGKGK